MEEIYRRAIYRVEGDVGFDMRVGQFSAALCRLFDAERCKSAAFLTAFNPGGIKVPDHANIKAQLELQHVVRQSGLHFIPAIGLDSDPDSSWEGEPSLLVLAISLSRAEQLACQFRQLAFVFCPASAVPQLQMLDNQAGDLDKR